MKKAINTIGFVLLLGVLGILAQSCGGTTANKSTHSEIATSEIQNSDEIKAYYFHANRRCATCEAVETVSKEAIKEYYGDKVVFESINRDEEKKHPLLAKYNVNGQTLIIIKGETKVDLTNDAFLNARTHPEKFKSKLKSAIDSMM